MFTGLVEKIAKIGEIKKTPDGAAITIAAVFDDLKIGDSVAVNGACQTVIAISSQTFTVEAMNETLNLTNLSALKKGDIVNLERAMSANGRFGGHFVSGHIDGTAKLLNTRKDGISTIYKFEFDTKYIVQKGSVTINGVSLTVSAVGENNFEVSLIPHTLSQTNLSNLKIGDSVNIEVDIMAKYVEKFTSTAPKKVIDENFLKECGF